MANKQTPPSTRLLNLNLAAIVVQAGCVTLGVILAALFVGLWIDSQLGRRGPCTVGLLVISIPVSLLLMVRLTLRSIDRLKPPSVDVREE